MIDLRSDTITKPTPGMLEAMWQAKVGDDVFNEDPTVNQLEETAAAIFGMEAALFCPSGTMTNQIAIRLHTQPQDEVICDKRSHIYNYEGGGIAYNSMASVRLLDGNRGRMKAADIADNINPDDIHATRSRLVVLENTVNKGGGCIYDLDDIKEINELCQKQNLKLHLDGARLFNALVETNEEPEVYGSLFNSISICLSKGLGAPVGSLLIGSSKDIKQAKRIRKVLGGAMRQAGYLAAAGIYALKNNVTRLKEDHQRAGLLSETLKRLPFVDNIMPVETNIIIFSLQKHLSVEQFLGQLEQYGVRAIKFGKHEVRMVTHLDFNDDMLDQTVAVLKKINIAQ